MLETFSVARFKFILRPETRLKLFDFEGSTFRGIFGLGLKRVACLKRRDLKRVACTTQEEDCSSCIRYYNCVYSRVFISPRLPKSKAMRLYPEVPHPFVLVPPLRGIKVYRPGEKVVFWMNLVGGAIDDLPDVILAFARFCQKEDKEDEEYGIGKNKVKFSLSEVRSIHSEEGERTIYREGQTGPPDVFPIEHPFRTMKWDDSSQLTIRFLTPFRVRYESKLTSELEFHVLFKNLLRRIRSLSYLYCDEDIFKIDFADEIRKSERIRINAHCLEEYKYDRQSCTQKSQLTVKGFWGDITYEGDFTEFIPWLRAAELVHVGSFTSSGHGKLKIVNPRF